MNMMYKISLWGFKLLCGIHRRLVWLLVKSWLWGDPHVINPLAPKFVYIYANKTSMGVTLLGKNSDRIRTVEVSGEAILAGEAIDVCRHN